MENPLIPVDEDINEIEKNVFIGNLETAVNRELLVKYNIKKILSVLQTEISGKYRFEGIVYKYINIWDIENEDIISYFPECFDFIFNGQQNEENVYVHCRAGRSRSVTIIAAFLMKKYDYESEKALNIVSVLRNDNICPNIGFKNQLILWTKMRYRLLGSDVEYRRVLVSGLKSRLQVIVRFGHTEKWENCSEAIKSAFVCYLTKVINAENYAMPFNRGKTYRCQKCSNDLFEGINEIRNNELEANCGFVYIEPKKWVLNQIMSNTKSLSDVMTGSLVCIKCNERLGVYDWSPNNTCSCEAHTGLDYYLDIKIDFKKIECK